MLNALPARAARCTPVLVCACVYLLAALLIWPVLASGMNDDWSIVRTAQAFAQSGHIHYNAWEAPMLLWQVWVAGAAIKLFGFSYLIVRVMTVLQSLLAIVLLQRCSVRAGATEWNAAFGTLVVALSPVFMGCSVAAMTDVIGLLALITCFYGCLRAVQAATTSASAAWLCFAAVSDVAIASARQIDFLGALVLVPSAVYVLRRNRTLLGVGAGLWVVSLLSILGLLHWFSHQPYILPQELVHRPLARAMLARLVAIPMYGILDGCLLILPACSLFLPAFRAAGARVYRRLALLLALLVVGQVFYHHRYPDSNAIAPFYLITFYHQTAENTFNSMMMPPKGMPPVGMPLAVQWGLTVLAIVALFAVIAAILRRKERPVSTPVESAVLPWNSLLILTFPILSAYMLLLLPRGVWLVPPDRYLLGFFPFVVLLMVRFFERHISDRIPHYAVSLLALIGAYSVLTMHDAFATFRGNLLAIDELRTHGVSREQIDGGWEYDFDTQVLRTGVVYAPGSRKADGTILQGRQEVPRGPCGQLLPLVTPDVHAQYAIAWRESPCTRVPGYPAVSYRTWLPPFRRELVIVRAQPDQWMPVN